MENKKEENKQKNLIYNAILFFGAPGAGKGTQAKLLADVVEIKNQKNKIKKYLHFSTGDMFRAAKNNPTMANSEIGKKITETISQGKLVSDDLTVELLFKTLDEYVNEKKFNPENQILILDGIPRNINQVDLLKHRINVLKVVYLYASDINVFAERLAKRATIEGRHDDADEKIVLHRLKVYEQETAPVLSKYPQEKILKIDAMPTIEEIHSNILKHFG